MYCPDSAHWHQRRYFNYNNTVVKQEISGAHEKNLHTQRKCWILWMKLTAWPCVSCMTAVWTSYDPEYQQGLSGIRAGYDCGKRGQCHQYAESEYIQSVELYSDISNLVLSSENGFAPVRESGMGGSGTSKTEVPKTVDTAGGEKRLAEVYFFLLPNPLLSQEKRGVAVLNVSAASLQKRT